METPDAGPNASQVPGPRFWHVTVTVAGEPVEPLMVRAGLRRLSDEQPFIDSMRFEAARAELQFWDEAESMLDAASLALRMWNEHRDSAGLPRWEVVGLEVVEREVLRARTHAQSTPQMRELTISPF